MTARKTTTRTATARAAQAAVAPDDQVIDAKIKEASEGLFASFNVYLGSLGNTPVNVSPIPTTKRLVIAFIASLAAMCFGIVLGAHVATALAVAALSLGFGSFLATVIYMMAYLVAGFAAMYGAGKLAKYIALGGIVEDTHHAIGWAARKMHSASTYVKRSMSSGETVH